jgi:U3 small nucleolar RNA-associated protein 4
MAVNPTSTLLALGCDDGSVRLLSLADGDVTPLRRLDRIKTRILNLAWGPPRYTARPPPRESDTSDSEDDEDESRWKDTYLVAGCSDSSIRKWDLTSGRVLERLTTDQVRGEKTLVWAVQVLLYVH